MPHCAACALTKARRRDNRIRHHAPVRNTPRPGEMLVLDHVPFHAKAYGGVTGLLVSTDLCSTFTHVKELQNPADMLVRIQEVVAFYRAHRHEVRIVRTDRGSTFLSAATLDWLHGKSIHLEATGAEDHHQVGAVERRIGDLKEHALASCEAAGRDPVRWISHAMQAKAACDNRLPQRRRDWRVPATIVAGVVPDFSSAAPFGSSAYMWQPGTAKTSNRARPMVYLGLDGERVTAEPGHILYNPATGKIAHSRHVTTSSDDLVQRALDASRVPETLPSLSSGGEAPVTVAALAPSTNTLKDPENRRAMLAGPHRAEFLAGEAEEIANLSAMGAYTFVNPEDIPEGTQILGGRWAYRYKIDATTGEITKYRSRWAVRGDQERGRTGSLRYSAQVSSTSVRTMFALLSANYFRVFWVVDIGNAYMCTPAARVIYTKQPEGHDDGSGRLWKLTSNWYGEDDAGRTFWLYLDKILREWGLESDGDPCVYRLEDSEDDDRACVCTTHVDDLGIFARHEEDAEELVNHIRKNFEKLTIDRAPTRYLGFQVAYEPGRLLVHQRQYAERVIALFSEYIPSGRVPPSPGAVRDARDDDRTPLDPEHAKVFRSLLGSLLYLAEQTRPDIAFAVNRAARSSHDPGQSDWDALLRVLHYVSGTVAEGLRYTASTKWEPANFQLIAYVDADYASAEHDRKSHTGIVIMLGANNAAIDWCSTRQHHTSRSSTEAELIALSKAEKQITILRRILGELGALLMGPTVVNEDNTAAITILRDPHYRGKTKHVDVQFRALRERIRDLAITLNHVPTQDQHADALTKNLAVKLFQHHMNAILNKEDTHAAREE